MSLVYFGTGEFAVPALEAVAEHVSLVVAQPDRPSGRGMKLKPTAVKAKALELGLEVATPEKARDPEFIETVRALRPDFLLVASYGQILPMALLESATHGGINLHGSILPKYRGAAPIQRAILDGETKTGITLMQMAKGMDTGDIIAVEETEIGPDETYGELQSRLALIAASMAKTWCARLASGLYPRMPQDDSQASIAPKVMKDEAELQMSNDAAQEYNRYRAFTPAPGAFISTRFGRVGIARAAMASGSGEPGTLLGPDIVAFSSGALQLVQVKPEGKTTMSGRDFTNGMRLRPGQSLIHE